MKKSEINYLTTKKLEQQIEMFIFLLKKIFNENVNSLDVLRRKFKMRAITEKGKQSSENLEKYSETLKILQIKKEEIDMFLSPGILFILRFQKMISFKNKKKNIKKGRISII